ncbi:hypothetical protein ACOMHN_059528 [Nucella lapillus]
MNDSLKVQWFEKLFLRHCGCERPQLFILDSHSSHEVLELLEKAEEQIYIYALPPHTTHHLQPLDKAVLGPLKKAYVVCTEFMSESPAHSVNKVSWPKLFRAAWEATLTRKDLIQKAFSATGIYSFNPKAVLEEAFMPSQGLDRPLPPTCTSTATVGVEADAAAAAAMTTMNAAAPSATATETSINMVDAAEIPSLELIPLELFI